MVDMGTGPLQRTECQNAAKMRYIIAEELVAPSGLPDMIDMTARSLKT
jgi:hypothetical protein